VLDYLSIARRALGRREVLREFPVLENVLSGHVIELCSDDAGHLFIVANEDDARCLGERRGVVYTAAEVRQVIQIADPDIVSEIHD
jgi:hypothetical protein